jgi:asparagine synthase (glutamine-hydrolysing)
MCGIAGIIYLDKGNIVDVSTIRNMTNSIYHRGPDDEGFYINHNVGLGFRRLSIIDLNTGHQPLSNIDNTIHIIFNGEIYNYKEQREILKNKGYVFKTSTDTEVIVNLYAEYGVNCLQYLRGMFSFAIWDNNKKQLFCARDRFGIKPFYYYIDNEKFVFASEIKAILKAGRIDKTISNEALDSYFAYGYITSDLSIYKNIKKLQPGNYLLLSFNEKEPINIKEYYEILFDPDYSRSEIQWSDEIENCLSETVKLHMISDVPLGAFLSGGIDSSSIVAMMAKNSSQAIKTFSIGFRDQKDNEFVYAREIAKKYGCEYHEKIIDPDSIDLLPKLVHGYDEPFADPSAIPTYYVSKFAREHVTVALSGDGGDELFAGYDIFRYLNNIHKFNSPYQSFNRLIWGGINKIIPQNMPGKGLTYFLSQDKENLGAYLGYWTRAEREHLISNTQFGNKNSYHSETIKEDILKKGYKNDFLSNLQFLTMKTYMVDDILTKVDRVSMLNSLEVRVPLLDHKFVELSLKIPRNFKLNGRIQKYILKQSMKSYLPQSILNHPKQGFNIPLPVWIKGDLKKYVSENLLSTSALLSGHLNQSYVKKIVENNQNGGRDLSTRIYSLLVFEEWLRQNQNV